MSYYSRRYAPRRKQRGTRRRIPIERSVAYINILDRLYPHCIHDDSTIRQQIETDYANHKITYGEMQYEGLEQLYQHIIKFDNNSYPFVPHCFLDIGSGRGKLCLYMAAKSCIGQSIGIELVKQRYEDALTLKNALDAKYPDYTKKVSFINSNILDISLKQYIRSAPVFVWFSNLCFDQSITDKIFEKLIAELPIGSIICCSKIPQIMNNGVENCKSLGQISIPMSWAEDSIVFIYQNV